MVRFRFRKQARMRLNLLASAAFIALAIYGWDLPVTTALAFLALCIVFLVAIVLLAAGCGWLLRRWRQRHDEQP